MPLILPTRLIGSVILFSAAFVVTASAASAAPVGLGDFSPSATLINFDNLVGGSSITTGDVITNQYQSQGIVFNDPDLPMLANASPIGSAAVSDSKPNVGFVTQHNSQIFGAPLELLLSPPVTMIGMQFFISIGASITLSTFDSGGQLLESLVLTGTELGQGTQLQEGFIGLQETTPIAMARLSSLATHREQFLHR